MGGTDFFADGKVINVPDEFIEVFLYRLVNQFPEYLKVKAQRGRKYWCEGMRQTYGDKAKDMEKDFEMLCRGL